MNFGLPEPTLQAIRQVLANEPAIDRVFLYGSRAKGTHRPGSDIDLAIEGPRLTHDRLLRLATALDELDLPHAIDLSLVHEIENPALLDHIRRVGIAFYPMPGQ